MAAPSRAVHLDGISLGLPSLAGAAHWSGSVTAGPEVMARVSAAHPIALR